MLDLGLIADRSEIMPAKKRSQKSNQPDSDSDGNEPQNHQPRTKKKPKTVKRKAAAPLDAHKFSELMAAIGDQYQPVLEWIGESLSDAIEDIDVDPSGDPDDCVPLVPFMATHSEALGNADFQALLGALGLQAPIEGQELYWRIPTAFTSADLRRRADLVAGRPIEMMDDVVAAIESSSESDSEPAAVHNQRSHNLLYTHSDDNDDAELNVRKTKKKNKKEKLIAPKKPKKNRNRNAFDGKKLIDQINKISSQYKTALEWIEESLKEAIDELGVDPSGNPDDCVPLVPFMADHYDALGNVEFKVVLKELGLLPPVEGLEMYWRIPNSFKAVDLLLRADIVSGVAPPPSPTIEDAGSDDEVVEQQQQPKRKRTKKSTNKFDIFDMVKETTEVDEIDHSAAWAHLIDSDDSADANSLGRKKTNKSSKRKTILDSDDDENVAAEKSNEEHIVEESSLMVDDDEEITAAEEHDATKRNRSDSEDSIDKTVKRKRLAIIDDDTDED